MGRYYAPEQAREKIASELNRLGEDWVRTIVRWEDSIESGEITDPGIYLNDTMAVDGLARLRKLLRELDGKIDDVKAGLYRAKPTERKPGRHSKPKKQGRGSQAAKEAVD